MSDRSDEALRERLDIANKASWGPWKESVQIVNGDAVSAVSTACGDEVCNTYGNLLCDTFDASHIAASSPDVVRADLEEILALRADVARLEDEVASLEQELKFSDETEYALIRKLFDLKICHKEVICEQTDAPELNFEGQSGCLFCWRQWAIRKAREAESEGE